MCALLWRGREALRRPGLLRLAVPAYLALLPLGALGSLDVRGAEATASDLLLLALLAVGLVDWFARRRRKEGRGGPPDGSEEPKRPAAAREARGGGLRGRLGRALVRIGSYRVALLFLVAYGVWAGASALWSFHPAYALLKGGGYVALALGAACIAASEVEWERALDAWLVGTGAALLLTLVVVLVGPTGWAARFTYGVGSLTRLPLPRLRGPFLSPSVFGDYLVVSGAFLWARWPAWTTRRIGERPGRRAWTAPLAWVGAALLGVALLLTVSTAWLGAGVLLLLWGRRLTPRRKEGLVEARAWLRALSLRAVGAALTAVTMAGMVVPLRVQLAGIRIGSSGIRPRIWGDAARAFVTSPVVGVGAAPYLAGVTDPLNPSAGPVLWDAHNVYLSVLGQFGLVGLLLAGVGVWFLVRALRHPRGPAGGPDLAVVHPTGQGAPPAPILRNRARLAVLAALVAMGAHGIGVAGEDFRHWWAVVGVAGVLALAGRRE